MLIGVADADDQHHDIASDIVSGIDHGELPNGRVTNFVGDHEDPEQADRQVVLAPGQAIPGHGLQVDGHVVGVLGEDDRVRAGLALSYADPTVVTSFAVTSSTFTPRSWCRTSCGPRWSSRSRSCYACTPGVVGSSTSSS